MLFVISEHEPNLKKSSLKGDFQKGYGSCEHALEEK